MVRKNEVLEYFNKKGVQSEYISNIINEYSEDEIGIYSLMGEFIGKRDYYILENIIQEIRKKLDEIDLNK